MNSQIHTPLVTGFIEDRIRSAAEGRLLPEYRHESRSAWTLRRRTARP
jgi:hypothetical protein